MDKEVKDLPDNISICSRCDEHSNDDTETVWSKIGNPYHRKCLAEEVNED